MANILCAWEFGAGLGHLTQLIPIAERLQAAGHLVTLAVPSPAVAVPLLKPAAPGTQPIRLASGTSWSVLPNLTPYDMDNQQILPDVLRLFDFHNPQKLASAAVLWDSIIAATKPDIIIADISPSLRLAAPQDIPFVVIGNGYTIPPAGRPFPPLRPWETTVSAQSRARESEILWAINLLRHKRNAPAIDYVSDLFSGDENFVFTFAAFDPYEAYRTKPPLLPFNAPTIVKNVPLKQRQEAPVFVYLHGNHPRIGNILGALAKLKIAAEAYITEADMQKLAAAAPPNVKVLNQPVNFGEKLGTYRMIIHHGGLATSYAALQAGTPQIVMPPRLEHLITSRKLVQMGCAVGENASNDILTIDKIAEYIESFTRPESWKAVEDAAKKNAGPSQNRTLDITIERITHMLNKKNVQKAPR